jgi:alpha-glucosidase
VADYRQVDPLFGTNADFDRLLDEAHRRGLKIIIDMVLSHCSVEHAWFQESRESRDNPKADWFVWADPKPDGTAPNNWLASFGGISWTWEPRRQQYYLHNFLTSMPQLNHHNSELGDAVLAECAFWLDKGVDGFRLDVANYYTHDPQLRDNPPAEHDPMLTGTAVGNPAARQRHIYDRSRPETIPVLARLRELSDRHPDRFLMAEIHDPEWDRLISEYTQPGLLHSAYGLTVVRAPNLTLLRPLVEKLEQRGDSWPSWAFSNHDTQRVLSRWGPPDAPPEFAKQMLALLLSLRGTPIIYQGEELGLPEADIPFERIVDPPGKAFWPVNKGRDGARSPMPWRADAPHAGFSPVEPWLPVDPRHFELAVDRQESDPDSTLAFCRRFIAWRKQQRPLIEGDARFIDLAPNLLCIERSAGGERLLAIFNAGEGEAHIEVPERAVPLAGHGLPFETADGMLRLPRYGAAFLRYGRTHDGGGDDRSQ